MSRLRLIPSLPLIAGLAALARALGSPRSLLNDPDIYLHIAAGRWMLAHRALPLRDPFSYTHQGATWVPHEWLAEIVLAVLYGVAGWSGVVLTGAICFAAAIALLTRYALRSFEPLAALVVAALAVTLILGHVLARPHLLALPLLVVWAGTLTAARDREAAPSLWLLPLMTVWANLHAGFMFGLALALFYAVEAAASPGRGAVEARRWGGFVLLAVGAALITPNGIAGLVQPFRLLAMPTLQSTFVEWQSPDFEHLQPVEFALLGLILIGFTAGVRLRPFRLLLVLGLCHMALAHARNAELLGLVAPLALANSLGPAVAEKLAATPRSGFIRYVAALAAPARLPAIGVTIAIVLGLSLPLLLRPIQRSQDLMTPAAALAAAARLGLTGPVWNAEVFGGYLMFRGVPTFIDGRIELYGDRFLARDFAAERGDKTALTELLDHYQIAWTLLPPNTVAVGLLDLLPGWKRVYADEFAVIHRRIDEPR